MMSPIQKANRQLIGETNPDTHGPTAGPKVVVYIYEHHARYHYRKGEKTSQRAKEV